MNDVVRHLRQVVLRQGEVGLTDGELLGHVVERRDEDAFAALVRRHGPMVWGVCRRVLRNHHDAEDAFQATFLVLVRKAASIKPRGMVGNWLYGVAYQTALKARAFLARQRTRESQVRQMPEMEAPPEGPWRDLRLVLDQELSRLPPKYRAAIVLCDLEGRTRKQAALLLGLPEGTLAGHLTRGRAILARRLTRRGLGLSSGLLATTLPGNAATASVPPLVLASTLKAAAWAAAGHMAAAGAVSANVAFLTRGVLKAMFFTKAKTVTAISLCVCALGTGLGASIVAGQCQPAITQSSTEPAAKEDRSRPALGSSSGKSALDEKFARIEHRFYEVAKANQALRQDLEALRKELKESSELKSGAARQQTSPEVRILRLRGNMEKNGNTVRVMDAVEVANVLNMLRGPHVQIVPYASTNSIVIRGTPAEINEMVEMVIRLESVAVEHAEAILRSMPPVKTIELRDTGK